MLNTKHHFSVLCAVLVRDCASIKYCPYQSWKVTRRHPKQAPTLTNVVKQRRPHRVQVLLPQQIWSLRCWLPRSCSWPISSCGKEVARRFCCKLSEPSTALYLSAEGVAAAAADARAALAAEASRSSRAAWQALSITVPTA